jgi:hypothetical protein
MATTDDFSLEVWPAIGQDLRMRTIHNRQFPRAPFTQSASVRMRGVGASFTDVPAIIRSISCEGCGVALEQPWPLTRGQRVTVSFRTESAQHFAMPGVIAWRTDAMLDAANRLMDFGVRFNIAAISHHDRMAYAEWIVGVLRERGVAAQPAPSVR